jgi:hypothetical protein
MRNTAKNRSRLAACAKQIRYVTHNGAGPHTSFNPSWSPGGSRIAYTEAQFRPDWGV